MTRVNGKVSATARLLRGSASTLVLGAAIAALMPSAALAQAQTAAEEEAQKQASVPASAQTDPNADQNADGPEDDTIIVTGQRRALNTSQGIKRNAETVVDSITATDIGAFPDKSVAEALQRVPGVTVSRFAGTDDTTHFSAEPSGVIVRGLPQVRSEFNGRDTFSANSSRGLSWGDISPELMAGVDTYKNQTAEMIEGGIAGLINLRTRVPFDAQGQLIQASLNLNYGDISGKITPELSAFYSNRWETGIGEIGFLVNGAYSKIQTETQNITYGRAGIFDNSFGATGPKIAYIPSQLFFKDVLYDRERKGIALAGQWRSLDRSMLLTAQFNRSEYENVWRERGVQAYFFDVFNTDVRFRFSPGGARSEQLVVPAPGTPAFTFDEDGVFTSGTMNLPSLPWVGNPSGEAPWGGGFGDYTAPGYAVNDRGQAMFSNCYAWAGPLATNGPGGPLCTQTGYTRGSDLGTSNRFNRSKSMTQDAAINLKWEATDNLSFNFDAQYVDATLDDYGMSVEQNTFANVALDATGSLPRVVISAPTNVNQSAGGLANPNNWYVRSIMDHLEESEGEQYALRADGEYKFDSDWLASIKFGGRYAKRDQTIRNSAYNWRNISNTWTGNNAPYWNLDRHNPSPGFSGYPKGLYEIAPFGAGFFGGTLGDFAFVPFSALEDRSSAGVNGYSYERTGVGTYIPICDRNNQIPGTVTEMPDSCFAREEIADVSEDVRSIYAMIRFGGPNATLGGEKYGTIGVSGNIGLRYVETRNESEGFLQYPSPAYNTALCPATALVPGGYRGTGTVSQPQPGQPPTAPFPAYCYLTGQDISFASGGGQDSIAKATHKHFLPSFNIRLDLSDKWLLRLAASKALSRPDIGLLKNYAAITVDLPAQASLSDSRWIRNAAGAIVGVTPRYTASAFNPFLKPTTAWQFDLSLENYFADVGSFTFALFFKKFSNYIQFGSFGREVTKDGVTNQVLVRGPANGRGAEIRGFEIAYQRFFDFLPAPLDGLGIQANYTFVQNKGVPNDNLVNTGTGGEPVAFNGTMGSSLNPGSLEGLSKHSYNLVGMYEKGRIAARVAYNWRSRYLVTAVDCCVYLPVWQEPTGLLDGSIRYRLTDNIEISLQGSNLLNTKTRLSMQVTDQDSPEGRIILTPNAVFQHDRRFVFGTRFRF